jgi:hypothetical protein
VRLAVLGHAAEFQPRVAHAARVLAHEQVPAHGLGRIAVGLDARRPNLGVEQER